MSAAALGARPAGPHAPGRPVPAAAEATLPLLAARGSAFLALAAFGVLHWMALLQPAQGGRALEALVIAVLGVLALTAAAQARSPRRARVLAAAAVLPLLALALLAGGFADEWLLPGRWPEVAAGLGRAITGLPGVRVPYRGADGWTRTAIPTGGTVLVLLAALLAFWPRRGRTGFPALALLCLVVLYVVPAITVEFDGEFIRGAVLALLVLAFLRLERVGSADAGLAGAIACGAAVVALVAAPVIDRSQPWWDYEAWADDTASARTVAFSWDHSYAPLTWPRDGRELLRVKARFAAYWKAENLDAFDGLGWRRQDPVVSAQEIPGNRVSVRRFTQRLQVEVRNLRTDTFVAAGFASLVAGTGVRAVPTRDGGFTAERPLHRGDTYSTVVYTPQPTEQQRRAAGTAYPPDLARYRFIELPIGPDPRIGLIPVTFPAWGDPLGTLQAGPPGATRRNAEVDKLLSDSFYARTWALAKRLKRGASTPEDYVERVMAHLGDGYGYTETPAPAARTLEGFLFDAKAGYCQQFSGAMALLLRMGGIPARVATGFSAGAFDHDTGEYVVRDLDAHSWVEAYFPNYGWVTFDPTPAIAPPRSQPDEGGDQALSSPIAQSPRFSGGDVLSRRSDATTAADTGAPWWQAPLPAGVGALLVALLAGLLVRRRRRAGPRAPLGELERALRRARAPFGPGTTLQALERRFAASPGAAGYVRAVREARYGTRPQRPTPAQRRGLRAELARGRGVAGHLRAWWAVPPAGRRPAA